MRLARQLGARRFEAQGLELQARILLDTGRPRGSRGNVARGVGDLPGSGDAVLRAEGDQRA